MNLLEEYSEDELLLINVTFLGLDQGPWILNRGQRLYREYTYKGALNVKDSYIYEMDEDNKNVESMSRQLEWYDIEQEVGLTKSIPISTTAESLKKLNREIRQNRMDFLEANAEKLRDIADSLPKVEPYATKAAKLLKVAASIDLLFKHYSTEVAEYIQRGTSSFEDAINSETNTDILTILAIPVREPDDLHFPNGLTVKQSIQYQIDGTIP